MYTVYQLAVPRPSKTTTYTVLVGKGNKAQTVTYSPEDSCKDSIVNLLLSVDEYGNIVEVNTKAS